ncbi:hypothetical protein RJ55_01862 [Drechmeria coniospora]|nr:hypothetical protein RJ55_01862 [Drechmeria coniospora]
MRTSAAESAGPDRSVRMAPSTLDLLVVTFNCAKTLVDGGVFARHLQSAFGQNATALPDLVVLSLQEIAPLSQAFIGDYFLSPYFARFDEAVNLAAWWHDDDDASVTSTDVARAKRRYTLVKGHNVGYTAILLFARDAARVRKLQEAEVGFGAAEMGNKGAVGLRVLYDAAEAAEAVGGERSTELTFVATHLAAMEWNLARRNANWAAIMRGLTFGNPEEAVEQMGGQDGSPSAAVAADPADGTSGERRGLLHEEHDEQRARLQRRLHDMSVFKPSSHLFVAGDLNYRISTTSPPPGAAFPSLDPASEHYYPTFFPLDQLTRERTAGRTLHGLTEHAVRFPPTYKYDVQPATRQPETEVPWTFAPHRYPAWTDRVLYLDLPSWVRGREEEPPEEEPEEEEPEGGHERRCIDVRAYDAFPVMRTSDHRAVFLRATVPLVPPDQLAPPAPTPSSSSSSSSSRRQGSDADASTDPRVRLPVEIDPEAWARRKAARRKEQLVGWSMFLWSTREGAWILATLLAAGLGAYLFCGAAA